MDACTCIHIFCNGSRCRFKLLRQASVKANSSSWQPSVGHRKVVGDEISLTASLSFWLFPLSFSVCFVFFNFCKISLVVLLCQNKNLNVPGRLTCWQYHLHRRALLPLLVSSCQLCISFRLSYIRN